MALGDGLNFPVSADVQSAIRSLLELAGEVEQLKARLAELDGESVEVDAEVRGDARRELDDIEADVRDLDGASPEIRPEVDSTEVDALTAKLDDLAGGRLGGFAAVGGPAGLGAAIGAGMVIAGNEAANVAIEVDNIAQLTGDTVETASRLAGVWKSSGADVTDLQDVLLQMGDVLANDAELAARIGVNLDDGRPLGERFIEVVDRLGDKFEDSGERSLVAAQLFGEEGVRQVNAVTAAHGELSAAVDEYNGKIWTQDEIDRARELKGEMAEMRAEVEKIALEGASGVVPWLSDALALVNEINDSTRTGDDGDGLFGWLTKASPMAALQQYNGWLAETLGLTNDNEEATSGWADTIASEIASAVEEATAGAKSLEREWDNTGRGIGGAITDAAEEGGGMFDRLGEKGVKAADDVAAAWEGALGMLTGQEQILDLTEQQRRVAEAERDISLAMTEEDRTKAIEDYQREVIRLAREVDDYAKSVDDIDEERVTNILTLLNQGSIAEAQRLIDDLVGDRTITIDFEVNQPGPLKVKFDNDGSPTIVGSSDRNDGVFLDDLSSGAKSVVNNTFNYQIIGQDPIQTRRDWEFRNGPDGAV